MAFEGGRWHDVDLLLSRSGMSALTGTGFEPSPAILPFLREECR